MKNVLIILSLIVCSRSCKEDVTLSANKVTIIAGNFYPQEDYIIEDSTAYRPYEFIILKKIEIENDFEVKAIMRDNNRYSEYITSITDDSLKFSYNNVIDSYRNDSVMPCNDPPVIHSEPLYLFIIERETDTVRVLSHRCIDEGLHTMFENIDQDLLEGQLIQNEDSIRQRMKIPMLDLPSELRYPSINLKEMPKFVAPKGFE